MNKPYSESCDQNREPILRVLKPLLSESSSVLEIGSGTGQHAVYFAQKMPHLTWHTSDCIAYLPGIHMWQQEAALDNMPHPVELDVTQSNWPENDFDAIFTANSVHIMSWRDVVALFSGAGRSLTFDGLFIIYGPFNYDQSYTSDSNERFDEWLKAHDPQSGIKNFEDLVLLADDAAMTLVDDIEMPANNRILIWRSLNP